MMLRGTKLKAVAHSHLSLPEDGHTTNETLWSNCRGRNHGATSYGGVILFRTKRISLFMMKLYRLAARLFLRTN